MFKKFLITSLLALLCAFCVTVYANTTDEADNGIECEAFTTDINNDCFCNNQTHVVVKHKVNGKKQKKCLPKCTEGFTYIGFQCQKICGQYERRVDGNCFFCDPQTSIWINENQCQRKCPKNITRDDQGNCTVLSCPDNMESVLQEGADTPVCMAKCPEYYERNGVECLPMCPDGYERRDGNKVCQKSEKVCPGNQYLFHNKCVKHCKQGKIRDITSGQCIRVLTCPPGLEDFRGTCTPSCPKGYSRNAYKKSGKCLLDCPPNFKRNRQGKCVLCRN